MVATVTTISILLTVITLVLGFWVFDGDLILTTGAAVIVAVILFIVAVIPAAQYSGIMPTYSTGERVGYVTKLSYKGVIWKTWEGQLQVGVGEMAAVQAPFEFSFSNNGAVLQQVQRTLGTGVKVRARYREWYVMPWYVGESGYELLAVEPVT